MSNGDPSSHGSTGHLSPTTSVGALSSHADSPRTTDSPASRKRKLGTSSRGVANLTPEKLAKKRANDREAQRAIRERTRTQIGALEERIKELTSQQPYQELQNVLHQKKLVELELSEIKKRLASIVELIQPVLSNDVLASLQLSLGGTSLHQNSSNGYNYHVEGSHSASPLPGLGSIGTAHGSSAGEGSAVRSPSVVERSVPFNHSMQSLLNHVEEESQNSSMLHGDSRMRPPSHSVAHRRSGSNPRNSLPTIHQITSPTVSSYSGTQDSRNDRDVRQPWEANFQWISGGDVFDTLLLEFTLDARRRRARGESEFEVIGPAYPNIDAILYPDHKDRIPCHAISRFLRDILTPFPDVTIVANKLAIAYVMFLILRWLIVPTRDNFDRLPNWVRPNSWQHTIAHAIWIDFVPWPDMRTEMVRNPDRYPFAKFFVPHTRTESVNWDHGEAAMYESAEGANVDADGDKILSHAFETHLRDIDNWTLGPAFAKEFPILAAACRITTRGEDERREFQENASKRAR